MISIRVFSPRDVQIVNEIAQETLNENYPATFFKTIHDHWPEGFLVAHDNGALIGFIVGVISDAHKARILMLVVRERYRRTGIAKILLRAFISSCVLMRINQITLEVRANNIPAINLYSKLGFRLTETLRAYYRDGEDGLRMERVLQS